MALRTDCSVISLDGASVTMTLAEASYINHVTSFEDGAINAVAKVILAVELITFEFAMEVLRSGVCLLGNSKFCFVCAMFFLVFIADLKSFITVFLFGLDLSDDVRKYFDDSDRISGAKTEVIPIFLPIMDFINCVSPSL